MEQNDIMDYIELGALVTKIETIQSKIDIGDMHYSIAAFESFPYFQSEELSKLRKDAIKEYYESIILAFYSACKLSYEKNDEIILQAIDACVEQLSTVLANPPFQRKQLPFVYTLHKLYEAAMEKLKMHNHKDNANHLEVLRKIVFMGWNIVG